MKESVMPFRGPIPSVSALFGILKVEAGLPEALRKSWQELDAYRSRLRFSDTEGWAAFHEKARKLIGETIAKLGDELGGDAGPSAEELNDLLTLISQVTEGAVRYCLDKRLPSQTDQIREELLPQLEHIAFDTQTGSGAVAVGISPAWLASLRAYVEAVHQRWTEQFFAGIGERIHKDTEKALTTMGMDVQRLKLPGEKQTPLPGLGGLFLRSFSQARGIAFSVLSLSGIFAVVGGKAADRSFIAGIGAVVFIIGALGAFFLALREQQRHQRRIPAELQGSLRKDIRQELDRHVEIMARRIREGVGGWKAEIDKEWRIFAAAAKKSRPRGDGPPSHKLRGLREQLQRAEADIRRAANP